jgi:hypothetical protein
MTKRELLATTEKGDPQKDIAKRSPVFWEQAGDGTSTDYYAVSSLSKSWKKQVRLPV